MPIPESVQKSWSLFFNEEFANTKAPYFGVNIMDVNVENWDAFLANIKGQREILKQIGVTTHVWAVRDHGARRRALWINYFEKPISELVTPEFGEGIQQAGAGFWDLIEHYDWFCVSEDEAP